MRRILLLLLSAIVLVCLDIITMEHVHSCTDEHRPSLYGFPLVHRTGVPWVNSMSGVRYVWGTVVNVACACALLWACAWAMDRWSWWHTLRIPRWVPWLVLVPGLLLLSLDLLVIEWHWQWSSDWDGACFTGRWRFFGLGQ